MDFQQQTSIKCKTSRRTKGKRKGRCLTLNRKKSSKKPVPGPTSHPTSTTTASPSVDSSLSSTLILKPHLSPMVRCTVAHHFTQLHQTPPKSTWHKVALDIITELKLSCSVNTIIAIFEAVLVDPEYDGKVKHASVRKNRNMPTSMAISQI